MLKTATMVCLLLPTLLASVGGGPSCRIKRKLGDDQQCFAHALWYVRTFGGIVEHPEANHAWAYYGITKPPKAGQWVRADDYGGWTCCVEQGHYGHAARKATWFYINGISKQQLIWGKSTLKKRIDPGYHSSDGARKERSKPGYTPVSRLSRNERVYTPERFRDILIQMCLTNPRSVL